MLNIFLPYEWHQLIIVHLVVSCVIVSIERKILHMVRLAFTLWTTSVINMWQANDQPQCYCTKNTQHSVGNICQLWVCVRQLCPLGFVHTIVVVHFLVYTSYPYVIKTLWKYMSKLKILYYINNINIAYQSLIAVFVLLIQHIFLKLFSR